VTALAALDGGLITPEEIVVDNGVLKIDVQELRNARDAVFGPIDMEDALRVSSDIYFYLLGLEANPTDNSNGLIAEWAQKLGMGERTGIDLPNEAYGLIPTPKWRNELYESRYTSGPNKGKRMTDRPWSAGDNINLSVGQGDLQADPLQVAQTYAAIGNGGDLVRPHLVSRVEDVSGRVLQEVRPQVKRHVEIDEVHRQAVMNGLTGASMSPGGTSYPIFGNFPTPVAGKTGTAERPPHGDQAWFVGMVPANDPQMVVAVTIEGGGFGSDTAAPVAARIIADYLDISMPAPATDGGAPEIAE
jgi:penicillin-binding protein 2